MATGGRNGEWNLPGNGPHVVVIDHHDSFTYNLVQALSRLGARVSVRLCDQITAQQLQQLDPQRLLLSPGPGAPSDAALAARALQMYRGRIPILGVCLGHQVIAEQLGARVSATGLPCHGKPEQIFHDGYGIFAALPSPFKAARYHSLAVERDDLPADLHITAWNEEGMVMGLGIPGEATWGVQFHPESFLTPHGDLILESFISGARCPQVGGEEEPGIQQERAGSAR